MALKVWLLSCLLTVGRTHSASVPLKFVTSPTQKPITYFEDAPIYSSQERLPKPQSQTATKDTTADDFLGGGNPIGSWKRWGTAGPFNQTSGQKPQQAAAQAQTSEKTFTQQQILEKLFSDYHKHLEKQKQNATVGKDKNGDQGRYHQFGSSSVHIRPKPISPISSGSLELETEEGTKIASPSNSHASYKLHRPGSSSSGGGGRPPKDGWVSLEPVPWSSSKISKWTPNKETFSPSSPWNSQSSHKPSWASNAQRPPSHSSSWSDSKPGHYSDNRPSFSENRPSYSDSRPTFPDTKPSFSDNRPLTWDDTPSKPSWSDTLHRPSWDTSKPSWTEANVKPSWGSETPIVAKPSWSSQNANKPSSSWTDLSNKPAFTGRPTSSWSRPSKPADASNHPLGIITDGKPPEWPKDTPASQSYLRPTGERYNQSNRFFAAYLGGARLGYAFSAPKRNKKVNCCTGRSRA
jgi:hypothetical protein